MSYEGSDILFEFFFLPADSITWSSREFDLGLEVYSSGQSASQALVRIETGQAVDSDTRLAVEVTGQSESDTAFTVRQSVSRRCTWLWRAAAGQTTDCTWNFSDPEWRAVHK
jgi:hypothetical protein